MLSTTPVRVDTNHRMTEIPLLSKALKTSSLGRTNDSRQAKELLETVDDLLTQSNNLLNSISRRLPVKQFENFEYKYTELNLMVVDVKEDVRDRDQRPIFFESDEERETFHSDIRKLLQQCEAYRNDVVTASHRVQLQRGGQSSFTAGGAKINDQIEESLKTGDSASPWVSILADTKSPDWELEANVDSGVVGSTKRFIATVAYDSLKNLASREITTPLQDENPYFRILICGNKNKRAVVVDTKPHYHKDIDSNAHSSQDELLRVGDMLMKSDPQELGGHQYDVSKPGKKAPM
ncbi:hypothetical protein OPQ81_011018 [Rhizoctonia solani]|nr:hypothetical protein OPQ81_011018 [Rhizoctonia solani]